MKELNKEKEKLEEQIETNTKLIRDLTERSEAPNNLLGNAWEGNDGNNEINILMKTIPQIITNEMKKIANKMNENMKGAPHE